jgi:hypothetical protein
VARTERGFGDVQEGLRVAIQEDHRVLYVLEVESVVKQAVIVRDSPATEGAGGPSWYVESWARAATSPNSLLTSSTPSACGSGPTLRTPRSHVGDRRMQGTRALRLAVYDPPRVGPGGVRL